MITRALMWTIRAYRWVSSAGSPRCRYLPTCSAYALEAVEQHGSGRGALLAIRRIVRCHPWGGFGVDEVPPSRTARAARHGIR